MTRKNMLADLIAATAYEVTQGESVQKLAMANDQKAGSEERVLSGPVRTMGLALERMENEAKALQHALASGDKVIELDPNLIDTSFVRDRLDFELTLDDDLVRSIEKNGQEVPILVRQHPLKADRFQVAYGHRRLAAIKLLNRKIKAVVRNMSDAELVVAQGVENNARKDLSYIERAIFAYSLENNGFKRETICQALTTDKGELSKLISVANRIPNDVVRSIGAAPKAGRRRWLELAEKLEDERLLKKVFKLSKTDDFIKRNTDDRFVLVLQTVSEKPKTTPEKQKLKSWTTSDRSVHFFMKKAPRKVDLTFTSANASEFGEWLSEKLEQLHAEFKQSKTGD